MMERQPIPGIRVEVSENDYRHFKCVIEGPEDTPFEGGEFPLEVFCPDDYPIKPPKCLFRCKIYHPNVNSNGQICLSILKTKDQMKEEEQKYAWTPALKISKVLLSIQALVASPNFEDPLDEAINEHWKTDREGAEAQAREWTTQFAPPDE